MKRSNAARTACLALALVLAAACLAGCESAQGGAADFGGEMPEGMELPEGMERPEGTGTAGGTGTTGGAQSQTLQVEVAETVTGEVESIVGNEVTLLLTDGTAPSAEAETAEPAELPAGTVDAEAAQTEETESSAQATATYLLPVGMPIGTGDYSTVSTGMVLELSLDADGDVVAASIR